MNMIGVGFQRTLPKAHLGPAQSLGLRLLDRIDIHIEACPERRRRVPAVEGYVPYLGQAGERQRGRTERGGAGTGGISAQQWFVLPRQRRRFAGAHGPGLLLCNNDMGPAELREYCQVDPLPMLRTGQTGKSPQWAAVEFNRTLPRCSEVHCRDAAAAYERAGLPPHIKAVADDRRPFGYAQGRPGRQRSQSLGLGRIETPHIVRRRSHTRSSTGQEGRCNSMGVKV